MKNLYNDLKEKHQHLTHLWSQKLKTMMKLISSSGPIPDLIKPKYLQSIRKTQSAMCQLANVSISCFHHGKMGLLL